jgi:hypothetical protein
MILGLITGMLEAWRMVTVAENPLGFVPGDLGFDPLEIYKVADEQERRSLQLKVSLCFVLELCVSLYAIRSALAHASWGRFSCPGHF